MKAIYLLEQLGIQYTPLTKGRINAHKRTWVRRFLPREKQRMAAQCRCFPIGDGCSDYLWHAFSFELLDGLTEDAAQSALSRTQRKEAILLSNWENAGFQLSDASALTASHLEEIDDVVLTGADYKWTYAKTHEDGLGPYFFQRN